MQKTTLTRLSICIPRHAEWCSQFRELSQQSIISRDSHYNSTRTEFKETTQTLRKGGSSRPESKLSWPETGLGTAETDFGHSSICLSDSTRSMRSQCCTIETPPAKKNRQSCKFAWIQRHFINKLPRDSNTYTIQTYPNQLFAAANHTTNHTNLLTLPTHNMKLGHEKTYKQQGISDFFPIEYMVIYLKYMQLR